MSVLLKKQKNEATVIGRLKEVELEEINGREGRVFLKGHATVEVKEKDKTHNIRVQIFENKYKRDGNVSALYTGAKKLTDEYVSIANAEEGQEATLVKITGELDHREYYDAVTARAVAPLNILLELATPLSKKYVVLMKANCEEELKNTKNLYKELNIELELKTEFLLPFENSKRTILKYLKKAKTNLKYPRRYDQIKKRPL